MEEIKEAVFKVMVGPEKRSRVMNDAEKKLTAYHEAGHALAIRLASTTDKVDRVSIIPSGRAGGYTVHKPDEDISYQTKGHLLESIVVALGGRAAEDLVLGEISTGAYGDLKQANNVARSMITKYGMSDELGNLFFGDETMRSSWARATGTCTATARMCRPRLMRRSRKSSTAAMCA
jgi:cell division protease FtsH